MAKSEKGVDRRNFLKNAAVGGMATLVASNAAINAQPFVAACGRAARGCTHTRIGIIIPVSKF